MKLCLFVAGTLAVAGCGGNGNPTTPGGESDASDAVMSTVDAQEAAQQDTAMEATGAQEAAATDDSSSLDTGTGDSAQGDAETGTPDAGDSGEGDAETGGPSSPDAACAASWLQAPSVDPSIELPDGGTLILHAEGSGTQDYTCTASPIDGGSDGGSTYAWIFIGPEATLSDCNATLIGHHFASDAGASRPEWQTVDGTYVIGSKLYAFTPDGGASSVPWLLLQATAHGGTGTLSNVQYIQRLNTDGGATPASTACDLGAAGTTQKVPYTADYFFFGP